MNVKTTGVSVVYAAECFLLGLLTMVMQFMQDVAKGVSLFYMDLLAKVVAQDQDINNYVKRHLRKVVAWFVGMVEKQCEIVKEFPTKHAVFFARVVYGVAIINIVGAGLIWWAGIAVRGESSVWGVSHLITLTEMCMEIFPLLGFVPAMLVFFTVAFMPALLSLLLDIAVLLWFPLAILVADALLAITICVLLVLGALVLCIVLPVNALLLWICDRKG